MREHQESVTSLLVAGGKDAAAVGGGAVDVLQLFRKRERPGLGRICTCTCVTSLCMPRRTEDAICVDEVVTSEAPAEPSKPAAKQPRKRKAKAEAKAKVDDSTEPSGKKPRCKREDFDVEIPTFNDYEATCKIKDVDVTFPVPMRTRAQVMGYWSKKAVSIMMKLKNGGKKQA